MARTYDSSRRTEAAKQTSETIAKAAFKLHGQGITDLESLAQEANVSLATVRKHFPTRELIFEACTSYGMHLVRMPDVEAIATTSDAAVRVRLAVRQLYGLHEEAFGQMWTSHVFEAESPVLTKVNAQMAELIGVIAGLIVEPWAVEEDRVAETRGFVTGMLHTLTYRALRKFGGLSPEQVIEHTTSAILTLLASAATSQVKEAAHT